MTAAGEGTRRLEHAEQQQQGRQQEQAPDGEADRDDPDRVGRRGARLRGDVRDHQVGPLGGPPGPEHRSHGERRRRARQPVAGGRHRGERCQAAEHGERDERQPALDHPVPEHGRIGADDQQAMPPRGGRRRSPRRSPATGRRARDRRRRGRRPRRPGRWPRDTRRSRRRTAGEDRQRRGPRGDEPRLHLPVDDADPSARDRGGGGSRAGTATPATRSRTPGSTSGPTSSRDRRAPGRRTPLLGTRSRARTRLNGRYSATDRSAKTLGNAASSPVRTKISQTWFASHTGAIESEIRSRCALPSRARARAGPTRRRRSRPRRAAGTA